MTAPRLELRGISKRYPGVIANDSISLSVMPGEIRAILGENGAGKSTLTKMIYGAVTPDSGSVLIDGQPVTIRNPGVARSLGIGMVYQHFSLFESISVVENIALALDGPFDLRALGAEVSALSARYGLPVEPRQLVHNLSVGERQRVEIIRCLLQKPKLLILDEPTSVLDPKAVEHLFEVLRVLAREGVSILYISHKMAEIHALCDTATILRGGRLVDNVAVADVTTSDLARMMVGASIPVISRIPSICSPKPHLEVIGLSQTSADPYGTTLSNISLSVSGGEILGIAGVSGNGQQELLSLLSGEVLTDSQFIWIDQQPVGDMSVATRRQRGLTFVPEERLGRGAVPSMSLAQNTLLTDQTDGGVEFGLIKRSIIKGKAQHIIDAFDVRCFGVDALAQTLSGGNLQKFIVGRELGAGPKSADRCPAYMGCRCGRCGLYPSKACGSEPGGRRCPGDIRRTG